MNSVLLLGLALASLVLLVWGVWKKCWKALLLSGYGFLLPSFTFSSQKGWFLLILLLPVIAFELAHYINRRANAEVE